MFYQRRLINHFRHFNQWVTQHQAKAYLDMQSFRVTVDWHGQQQTFNPQFYCEINTESMYGVNLTPDVTGFIGWLPYFNKRWSAAVNKLEFKKYIVSQGKRTPQYWLSTVPGLANVIIKPATGSFGKGLRGPFRQIDQNVAAMQLATNEFYEKFWVGEILKVWYWNDTAVCVELRTPLFVIGDGILSVLQLVEKTYPVGERAAQKYQQRRESLRALLHTQNTDWDAVPRAGERVQIDFLYGSSLYPNLDPNQNRLNNLSNPVLEQEIRSSGPVFWNVIPADIRQNTLYAIDGIVDPSGQVRWLEMNCNPVLPPDVYPILLNSVFNLTESC